MRKVSRISLTVALMLLLAIAACERQGPPPKPIGAATNKHVEETPAVPSRSGTEAIIQQMKTPTDDARQTEELRKGSGDRTRQQSDQTTP